MSLESLSDAEDALQRYIPKARANVYTLERMQQLLRLLGDPQERVRIVHVAGTSGKTSTCYFIRGLLEAAGCTTGLTISPHIEKITERIQVGGQPIADEVFVAYVRMVLEVVEPTDLQPTYFEILMALAYFVFAQEGVAYGVVETGLGGLLDGSNTVHRADKLAVISDIGLDHTEILGDTVELIAAQKAGIVQQGNTLVVQQQSEAALAVIESVAAERGAARIIRAEPAPAVTTLPVFQQHNFGLAWTAFEALRLRDGLPELHLDSLAIDSMQPPGRMELMPVGSKLVVLDGAHNGQKLHALGLALAARGWPKLPVLANAVRAPEAKLDEVFAELSHFADHLIITEFAVVQDVGKISVDAEFSAQKGAQAWCARRCRHSRFGCRDRCITSSECAGRGRDRVALPRGAGARRIEEPSKRMTRAAVAVDDHGGFARRGAIPWNAPSVCGSRLGIRRSVELVVGRRLGRLAARPAWSVRMPAGMTPLTPPSWLWVIERGTPHATANS